jgi:flotillin
MDNFIAVGLAVVVISNLLVLYVYASRIHKAGLNEVLIISGRTDSPRFVTGGRVFVWPVFERADTLSLELISAPIQLRHIKSKDGGTVSVTAVAQVKIGSDINSIRTAAIQLLSKSTEEIRQIAQEILTGNSKMLIGVLLAEQIRLDQEAFAQKVQEISGEPMASMGLEIVTFVMQDVETKAS